MFTVILLATLGQCQTPGYGVRTYAAPVAKTYAAPTYNAVVDQVVFIPSAAALYADVVGAAARQQNAEAAATEKLAKLTEAISKLEARLATAQPAAPAPQAPAPAAPPAPTTSAPPPPALTGLDAQVVEMFRTDCRKCHTAPGTAGGGFTMFNADGSLATITALDVARITAQVRKGRMPKGSRYDAAKIDLVTKWHDSHADEILAFIEQLKDGK